ncbi:hypothetical protein EV363DRAFT_1150507, partial [Boletus edulis]
TGKFDIIGGVKCYLATPIAVYSKEKIVLFLPDAFGMELVNNQVQITHSLGKPWTDLQLTAALR